MSHPILNHNQNLKLYVTGSEGNSKIGHSKLDYQDNKVSEAGKIAISAGAEGTGARAAVVLSAIRPPATVKQMVRSVFSLKGWLDGLLDKVNAELQKALFAAESVANNLIIKAGKELAMAIENARNAYIESLDYTVEKLDAKIQTYLNTLQTMVQRLEEKTEESLKDLAQNATKLMLTLPFANTQTKLMKVSPYYVVANGRERDINFIFEGIFAYSSTPKFKPKLTFGNIAYEPSSTFTDRLMFKVPLNALIPNAKTALIPSTAGTLSAPWDSGWIWSSPQESNFAVNVGLLPESPGIIQVEFDVTKSHIIEDDFESFAYTYYGSGQPVKEYKILLDDKWKIKPNSAQFIVTYQSTKDWSGGLVDDDGTDNTLVVRIQNLKGTVGFKVKCKKYKYVEGNTTVVKPMTLAWGDRRFVLKPEAGEKFSKIMFEAFDGSRDEFAGPNNRNPYLKVIEEGGRLKLEAIVPKEFI